MPKAEEDVVIYRWQDDETGKFSGKSLCGFLGVGDDTQLLSLPDGKQFKKKWPLPAEDGTIASYPARKETLKV